MKKIYPLIAFLAIAATTLACSFGASRPNSSTLPTSQPPTAVVAATPTPALQQLSQPTTSTAAQTSAPQLSDGDLVALYQKV
ncbi:MAG TPA: hypothetical protein VF813_11050, partial [Anaerolineaceae bacterium]